MNNSDSKIKYYSGSADSRLTALLDSRGYRSDLLEPLAQIDTSVASHADIRMCRLGCHDDSPIIFADADELEKMNGRYPNDVPFNAVCTGSFFIHNLKYTCPRLLSAALDLGMKLIDVKQGYTKCSTVIVDEHSIITFDSGIASACSPLLDVLLIRPGYVKLEGYDTGFIGGCSGRACDEIFFNGDLDSHPDGAAVREFIESRGFICTSIPDYPLTDIGSII